MFSSPQARTETLASQILLYKKLYYAGRAAITDEAYDALEEELKALAPHHPVLALVGYSLSENGGKVAHNPPMLSLAKTYDLDDLFAFVSKQKTVCADKFDGMALALEYGPAGNLMRASTRGSGRAGEDVTEHLFHVLEIPKYLAFVRKLEKHTVEVRGEIYFPISAFAAFSEQFDSYRNAVPGTFGRKEVDEAVEVLRVLKFCAYDFLIKDESGRALNAKETTELLGFEKLSYLEKLKFLEMQGLYAGVKESLTQIIEPENAQQLANWIGQWFERERDFQIDGIVFRYDDEVSWENLGNTSHHPRGSMAFKQTGEVAVTKILDIEEAVGRSGKITFRARLEPVQLSGAKISFATLHNAEFIESGGYAPGAVVKIKRSGEVIPAIIGLHEAAPEEYVMPRTCPCGYDLTRSGPDLFCFEKRPCPVKDQESLVHFVHMLDIMGVSDKIILRLRDAALLQEPADLFKLQQSDLETLEGFGKKSAENVIAAIALRREMPLSVFLTALGLKRGGVVKSKEVARKFKTLSSVLKASAEEMKGERGWADKSADDFFESLQEKSRIVENLLQYVNVLPDDTPELSQAAQAHPYFGKSICITGALSRTREEYKNQIERIGAKLVSAVTGKTDFLVCNEASGSSKYKQAMVLKIPILTETEFAESL